MSAYTYITAATTHHTGGNCRADLIELKNGQAICITDECLALYNSAQEFHDGSNEEHVTLLPEPAGPFARRDQPEDSEALVFVESIEAWEPGGPVSADLLTLPDGRVLVVSCDQLGLYPSREAFEGGVFCDAPGLDLAPDEPCAECARSYGPHYRGPCDH